MDVEGAWCFHRFGLFFDCFISLFKSFLVCSLFFCQLSERIVLKLAKIWLSLLAFDLCKLWLAFDDQVKCNIVKFRILVLFFFRGSLCVGIERDVQVDLLLLY